MDECLDGLAGGCVGWEVGGQASERAGADGSVDELDGTTRLSRVARRPHRFSACS